MSRRKPNLPTILHIQSRYYLNYMPDVIYIGSQDQDRTYPDSKWIAPQLPREDIKRYPNWMVWRAKMIENYERYIRSNSVLMNSILELEGKKLACWCDMYPCYGEVLIKIFCEKTGHEFIPHEITFVRNE